MATKLKNYKFKHGRSIYPWDKWTDGSVWKIVQGEDFDTTTSSMRAQLFNRGKKEGLNLRTNLEGTGVLIFQFFEADK